MKILFLINTLRVGGYERDVASLCEHVDLNRFQPEVWVLHGGGLFEQRVLQSGIKLRNLGRGWARNPLFAWRTAREISRFQGDLIHAFLPSVATYAAFARTWFGVRQPMVMSIGQSHANRRERWMFRWCSRTFDWLIANSPSAEHLARSLGFSREKISIIPNGHDVAQYRRQIDRNKLRRAVGVNDGVRMLLCVGRLISSKRICDAISALALLNNSTPTKLVITGDGPERSALESQATRLGLLEKVVFAGKRMDVVDLLLGADVFVFPSETEGLPNALIEACLARLPVVACNVPGVCDVVEDGQSAILVPPRNPLALAAAIERVLFDRNEAQKRASAAESRAVSRYSVECAINGLHDVYKRLIASHGTDLPAKQLCGCGQIDSQFSAK